MLNAQLLDQLLRVTDALAADMAGFLAGHDLNSTKAHLLWTLRGAGPQMQRRLAEELGHSPRHVTTLVDDLMTLGLVERRPHPEDRRAVLVALTGAGQALTAGFETDRLALAEALFGDLDEDTRSRVGATLTLVADRVDAATAAASTPSPGTPR